MTSTPASRNTIHTASAANSEFESIVLLLQGGGALGAYQGGVYAALAEADIHPDWVGGISIGAVNGAIIAGNKPDARADKLHAFWETITANPLWDNFSLFGPLMKQGSDRMRAALNQFNAGLAVTSGVPGFFRPHAIPPWFSPPDSGDATSFYDTGEFRKTLLDFVDFDLLNNGPVRYTVSAVNVRTGNYELFDTKTQIITPEHVMASGALPPALPPVDIGGQDYWDGGVISNTPLEWIMNGADKDTLVFQVDLWSARGAMPKDMLGVMTRQKEIQYSSRTRAMTTRFRHVQKLRHAFATLYENLPDDLKKTREARLLYEESDRNVYNIVHLIYRAKEYEGYSKDFEFSRLSMNEHWKAGYADTLRSLSHPEILERPENPEGIAIYDMSQHHTEEKE